MGVWISCCYGPDAETPRKQTHAYYEPNIEEEYCVAIKTALKSYWLITGLPYNLIRGLLSGDHIDDDYDWHNYEKNEQFEYFEDSESGSIEVLSSERYYFLGLPDRPLYRELARRLVKLQRICQNNEFNIAENINDPSSSNTNNQNRMPYRVQISADELGLSEVTLLHPLPIPPDEANAWACATWLRQAGEVGVRELLGFRTTIGTVRGALPPSLSVLLDASRKPYRSSSSSASSATSSSGSHPLLSVAARARAKHAHRSPDSFFKEIKGSIQNQNAIAESFLSKILQEACWINIHIFGGASAPVLEVRIKQGYGARWAANWKDNLTEPTSVTFRGFLEPQMPDGHLVRWRH